MLPFASLAFIGGMITGSRRARRAPRAAGRSIVRPRSQCDACEAVIAAYDNVPVVSWLWLRGRCRRCARSIPARYPTVEAALGVAFVATAVVLRDDPAELALGSSSARCSPRSRSPTSSAG